MLIDTSTPVSRRRRRRLAKGLRNVVRAAGESPRALGSAIPVQRKAILYESAFILEIARDLDSNDDVAPRGVELLDHLLTHGDSPVYTDSPDGSLALALAHAHTALHLV
jgi:hypothetical protein